MEVLIKNNMVAILYASSQASVGWVTDDAITQEQRESRMYDKYLIEMLLNNTANGDFQELNFDIVTDYIRYMKETYGFVIPLSVAWVNLNKEFIVTEHENQEFIVHPEEEMTFKISLEGE